MSDYDNALREQLQLISLNTDHALFLNSVVSQLLDKLPEAERKEITETAEAAVQTMRAQREKLFREAAGAGVEN